MIQEKYVRNHFHGFVIIHKNKALNSRVQGFIFVIIAEKRLFTKIYTKKT